MTEIEENEEINALKTNELRIDLPFWEQEVVSSNLAVPTSSASRSYDNPGADLIAAVTEFYGRWEGDLKLELIPGPQFRQETLR